MKHFPYARAYHYRHPIGIDIHNHNIYAVQLKESEDGGLVVTGLAHGEFEMGTEQGILESSDALVSVLKEMVRKKCFRGRRAVVHCPLQSASEFPLLISLSAEETLEEAIIRETETHLCFPVEHAVIDYHSVVPVPSEEGETYRVYVTAAHRDEINRCIFILKHAGVSVEVVDAAISSLIRVHSYSSKLGTNPIILCNIGYTHSLLSIVTRDNIIVQRWISWGIDTLLRQLHTNFELSSDHSKSKFLLKNYGVCYENRKNGDNNSNSADEHMTEDSTIRAIYQIIAPYLDELIHQLRNIIGYAMSEEQDVVFEGIYVYGHAQAIFNFDRYLETRLNIPTKSINPMTELGLSDSGLLPDISEGAPLGLALGLAMRKVTWL